MFLANKLNKGGNLSSPDAQFNQVTMLLHGDGTNGAQNNTFLDSSTNAFSITRNGNTTQGSFSPYGSNWSNFFDGTGDYLTTSDNAAWDLGSGAFTIESWVYPTASPAQPMIIGQWTSSYSWTMQLSNDGNRYLRALLYDGSFNDYVSSTSLQLNAWNHCAFVRESNTVSLYLNGSRIYTTSYSGTVSTSSSAVSIGADASGSQPFEGYLSNTRVVVGTALYSGTTYTVPTAPLTAVTNTKLLTCQSNRFIDTSASPKTITANGNTSVQRFNPFGTSTAYSTSVIGGSGYFDGSGDYLTSSCGNVGTGDFTIEGWFYFRTTPSTMGLFQASSTSGGFAPNQSANLAVATGSSSTWQIYAKNTYTTSSSTSVPVNAWGHMALVRSGTTTVLYINGVAVITLTSDSTNYSTSFIGLGGIYDNSSYLLNGYLSNFRVVVGTAVYTAAFTPPTAQLTAISGTALLTNFTNGAIIDNAMMTDLETVGNAQISTSVKKYGTGSLAFDGAGDYLVAPSNAIFNMGTGNFTIECWAYPQTQVESYPALFNLTGVNDLSVAYNHGDGTANSFSMLTGATRTSASVTSSVNNWYHIALVRNGTTVTLYIDGTSRATTTNSSTLGGTTCTIGVYGAAFPTTAFKGYIDDIRITKGFARYTTTFTPPTSALSDTGPY